MGGAAHAAARARSGAAQIKQDLDTADGGDAPAGGGREPVKKRQRVWDALLQQEVDEDDFAQEEEEEEEEEEKRPRNTNGTEAFIYAAVLEAAR